MVDHVQGPMMTHGVEETANIASFLSHHANKLSSNFRTLKLNQEDVDTLKNTLGRALAHVAGTGPQKWFVHAAQLPRDDTLVFLLNALTAERDNHSTRREVKITVRKQAAGYASFGYAVLVKAKRGDGKIRAAQSQTYHNAGDVAGIVNTDAFKQLLVKTWKTTQREEAIVAASNRDSYGTWQSSKGAYDSDDEDEFITPTART